MSSKVQLHLIWKKYFLLSNLNLLLFSCTDYSPVLVHCNRNCKLQLGSSMLYTHQYLKRALIISWPSKCYKLFSYLPADQIHVVKSSKRQKLLRTEEEWWCPAGSVHQLSDQLGEGTLLACCWVLLVKTSRDAVLIALWASSFEDPSCSLSTASVLPTLLWSGMFILVAGIACVVRDICREQQHQNPRWDELPSGDAYFGLLATWRAPTACLNWTKFTWEQTLPPIRAATVENTAAVVGPPAQSRITHCLAGTAAGKVFERCFRKEKEHICAADDLLSNQFPVVKVFFHI